MIKVGSLFSGIGGIDFGLEALGMQTEWMCEIDKDCQKVLRKHFPLATIYDDVTVLDPNVLAPINILVGGFPCQDISVAGKGEGLRGARSGLWKHMLRIIAGLQPSYVIIENVEAIRYADRGLYEVLQDLAEIGYDAEWETIHAQWLGSPIRRSRVFIVAYPNSLPLEKSQGVFESGDVIRKYRRPLLKVSWNGVRINRSLPAEYPQLCDEPAVFRVADGLSPWILTDRKEYIAGVSQLGNSVMPIMAEFVGACVVDHAERIGVRLNEDL